MPLDPLTDPLLRAPRSHAPTIVDMTEAAVSATPDQLADFVGAIGASGGGGGVNQPTNLGVTATPAGVTVTSSTGADALLPLATATNAGLMAPAQHTKLAALPTAAELATAQAAQDTAIGGKAAADHTHTPASIGAATASQGAKADAALPANADAIADVLESAATGGPADLARIKAAVSGDRAKLTAVQQAQQADGATTALLNAAKTGLVDPVSGTTIALGGGGTVDEASVQAALTADPAGARAAMAVYSTTQVDQAIAAAGGGGVGTTIVGLSPLWTPVAYSTTIPLDGCKYMPATAVTGPVSFSVGAGALPGASCTVRLVADAANTPQFVGMTQSPDSDGWAPIADTIHAVRFWYDGTSALYDITQLVSNPVAVPIQGVPVILSAAPSTVSLSYSAALLSPSVPLSSAYAITTTGAALSIAAVAVSGATVNLTLSRAMTAGETVTLSYTAPATNQIKSVGGMPAASFTGIAVTNGMALDDYLTFAVFPSFAQGLKNDAGYDTYVSLPSATVGGFTPKSATPSRMLVASPAADQYFEITLDADQADAANIVIALHLNISSQVNTTATYACYGNSTTGYWKQQTGGMTMLSGTTPYAGSDRARYVRTPANTLRFEVSKDDGATWIVIATKTAITDGSLYPRIGAGGPSQTIRRPKCNGPAAV